MMYIDRKKICCIGATIFYVCFVISSYIPFLCTSIFAGVDYNGYVLFYATALFLFGITVFWGFGETEKYIGSYGIIEIIRYRKRSCVARKIIFNQFKNTVLMLGTHLSVLGIAIVLTGMDNVSDDYMLTSIMLFGIVSFSVMMWQAIFELIWDSRIGIILTLTLFVAHIYAGDMMNMYGGNKYWNLLFYSNFGIAIRSQQIDISEYIMFIWVAFICVLQMFLLCMALKKKDIFSVKD